MERNEEKRSEILKKLAIAIDSGGPHETFSALQKLINADNICHESLILLSDMIETLPLSASQAKVLKDLPDLEEDSLGVDRGSEQTVAIATDHLDK